MTVGVSTQPVVQHVSSNIQVGISHAADWGGAIALPEEHPMRMDIEEVQPEKSATIQSQFILSESWV